MIIKHPHGPDLHVFGEDAMETIASARRDLANEILKDENDFDRAKKVVLSVNLTNTLARYGLSRAEFAELLKIVGSLR